MLSKMKGGHLGHGNHVTTAAAQDHHVPPVLAQNFDKKGVVAPLPRPLVQTPPAGESAPGQEVVLHEMEGPFYPPRTIRIQQPYKQCADGRMLGRHGLSVLLMPERC